MEDEKCSEICTCEKGGEMKCEALECHADAVCEIQEGILDCYCKEGHKGDGRECEGRCMWIKGSGVRFPVGSIPRSPMQVSHPILPLSVGKFLCIVVKCY